MNYPPICIRGLANFPDCINPDGQPNANIFKPHSHQNPNEKGWFELSINWEDNGNIVEFSLNQRKSDNSLHYIKGIVRMNRERIDGLKQTPPCRGVLDYNRQPLDGNPYHGNLLMAILKQNGTQDKALRRAIAEQLLTTIVGDIIPQPNRD